MYATHSMLISLNSRRAGALRQLQNRGVTFLQRTLSSLQELKELTCAKILVNASGLGARELAADDKVYGVRG
jgi:D-amino-acid oxidase